MTISQHIDTQVNRLSLDHLTVQEREWLHGMRTLAMWSYIAKYRREFSEHRKGA